MRKTETGLEMTAEELTISCYRVWCNVTGIQTELESLPVDEQSRWLKAVRGAFVWLPTLDGMPVGRGVERLIDDWCESDPTLKKTQSAYLLEWEAVLRHLNAIMDGADELEDESDVLALESSWASWLERRPRKAIVE